MVFEIGRRDIKSSEAEVNSKIARKHSGSELSNRKHQNGSWSKSTKIPKILNGYNGSLIGLRMKSESKYLRLVTLAYPHLESYVH